MSSGMSEYWKNKKALEEERQLQIKFDEIFEIIQDTNKNGNTIYRIKFKYTGQFLKNGMTNKHQHIKILGWRWLKKNQREANDMIFEHVMLTLEGLSKIGKVSLT